MSLREGFIGANCKTEPASYVILNVVLYMVFETPLPTRTIETVRVGRVAIINRV